MFIGHFAPAFAARAVSSNAPKLGTLFVAAQLVDFAFFLLVMVGAEHMRIVPGITAMNPYDFYDMPFTHSLLGTAMFGLAFALFIALRTRNHMAGLVAMIVVVSHWVLDLLVHRPDLTLGGRPPKMGFELWDYPWIEMPLELLLTLGAFWFYVRRTKGPVGPPVILLVLLLAVQGINWFGPEPEEFTIALPLIGLGTLAVLSLVASWVGSTRFHKREVGLAVASTPR